MSIKSTKGNNSINTNSKTKNIKKGTSSKIKLKNTKQTQKTKKNQRRRKKLRKLQEKTLNTLENSNTQEEKSIEAKGLNNSIENINRYAPTLANSAKSTAKFAGKTLAKANYKTKELFSKRNQELAKTIGNIKIKNTNSSSNFKSSKSGAKPVNVKLSLKQRKTNTSNSKMNKAIMPKKKQNAKKNLKKQLKNRFFSKHNRLNIRKIIKNIDLLKNLK